MVRRKDEDKNIYQLSREHAGLSIMDAADRLHIDKNTIDRIESGRRIPEPDEVISMASEYGDPGLCNKFCARDCPIGQTSVAEIQIQSLEKIVLQMLSSINALEEEKDRIIDVAADGSIEEDELLDVARAQHQLKRIKLAADTLQYWIDDKLSNGGIDREEFQKAMEAVEEEYK